MQNINIHSILRSIFFVVHATWLTEEGVEFTEGLAEHPHSAAEAVEGEEGELRHQHEEVADGQIEDQLVGWGAQELVLQVEQDHQPIACTKGAS